MKIIIRKIYNLFKLFRKLKVKGAFSYIYLKYFNKNNSNSHEIKLKDDINFTINQKSGDLCRIYEVFVDENYMFKSKHPDDIKILDIGAHIGFFSIYASRNFPKGSVFAFEPFLPSFEKLNKNIKKNNIGNIKTFPYAISDKNGKVNFYSVEWSGCNTIIPDRFDKGNYSLSTVESVTLDKVFKLTGQENFDFAKVDCEGSEYLIFLNSGDDYIKRIKEYVMEVHLDKKYSPNDLITKFESLEYKVEYKKNILRARMK